MDDRDCRRFFLNPQESAHRRYEALRAIFIENHPLDQVAQQFGYRPAALRSLVSRFRTSCRAGEPTPFFSAMGEEGPQVSEPARTNLDPNYRRRPTAES